MFSKFGSPYIGHPNNKLPGIEMNSGSLGHGLPVCVGMALAGKWTGEVTGSYGDGRRRTGGGVRLGRRYVGEPVSSGQSPCAVVDRNHLQISGNTEAVMGHENLHDRFVSFGWHVIDVADGNDIAQPHEAFEEAKQTRGKPSILIANTVKGKGSAVMENKAGWHHKVPQSRKRNRFLKILQCERRRMRDEYSTKQKSYLRCSDGGSEKDTGIVVLCSDSRGLHR